MEGFVSKRWTGVATLAVSLSVVWLIFILLGSPWTGLMWVVSLAFAGAIWSIHLQSQAVPAVATAMRAATPAPKSVV